MYNIIITYNARNTIFKTLSEAAMKNMKRALDTHVGKSDSHNEKLRRDIQTDHSLPQDAGVDMDGRRIHASSAEEGRPDTGAPCEDGECVLFGTTDVGMTCRASIGLPR